MTSPATAHDWRVALATAALVAAAVWLVYGGALDAPFIFDDQVTVETNPTIRRLWPLGAGGPLDTPKPARNEAYSPVAGRPLVNLSLAIDYHFFALRPTGYHADSLVIHALSAILLAALVRRTLHLTPWQPAAEPLALLVALLWAVHPLQTEAVIYVTQRSELLLALCFLGALYGCVRHWTSTGAPARAAWLLVTAIACVGGMAAKEVMLVAPAVALLYERIFLGRSFRRALLDSAPLYAVFLLGSALLVFLKYRQGLFAGGAGYTGGISAPVWWLTQAKVVFLFLKLSVWPWPLVVNHRVAWVRTLAEGWPWLVGLALLVAGTLLLVRRREPAGFAAAWFGLVLLPTLVTPLAKQVAAERRMYLPLAAIVALAVVGGEALARRRGRSERLATPVVAVVLALVVASGLMSRHRLDAYREPLELWRQAVGHQPDDAVAHANLAVALLDAGRVEEALAHCETAARLDPNDFAAHNNGGAALVRLGRPAEAIAMFEQARRLRPEDPAVLKNEGAALLKAGRSQDAVALFEQAIARDPNDAQAHMNLGNTLLDVGRSREAIAELEQATRLNPGSADPEFNLANALVTVGRGAEAIAHFERALRLAPDDVDAHTNLGSALLGAGRGDEAMDHLRKAAALRPGSAEARNNLGAALLGTGRPADAIGEFQAALRLKPDYASAHHNLGMALLETGRPADAVPHFEEALRLDPDDAQAGLYGAMAHARVHDEARAVAMAERSLEVARVRGQTVVAEQIASWLAAQRAGGTGSQ